MIVIVVDFGLLRTNRGSHTRTTFSPGLALYKPPNRLDTLVWGTCTFSGRLCALLMILLHFR